jgi:replicative DNA helicase
VNEKKGNVLVFSIEMPSKALMKKTICRFGSLFMQKINTGQALDNDQDSARLDQAMQQVVNTTGKFIIDDKGGQHISQIRARAKRAKMKNGKIDLIVVDYLQLIQAEGNSKNDIVSNVSAGLKNLAKEMRCPVIALSQLNRALVGRPEMKNLRDSGAIEQDADVIIFLHDEDYEKNRGDHSLTEIIFGKQRVGPTGTTYLQPELAFSRFADTKRLPAAPTEEQPSGRKYAKREFN